MGNQPCHGHPQAWHMVAISGSVLISISPHAGGGRILTPDWKEYGRIVLACEQYFSPTLFPAPITQRLFRARLTSMRV
jgi:hypothetical protein